MFSKVFITKLYYLSYVPARLYHRFLLYAGKYNFTRSNGV